MHPRPASTLPTHGIQSFYHVQKTLTFAFEGCGETQETRSIVLNISTQEIPCASNKQLSESCCRQGSRLPVHYQGSRDSWHTNPAPQAPTDR